MHNIFTFLNLGSFSLQIIKVATKETKPKLILSENEPYL